MTSIHLSFKEASKRIFIFSLRSEKSAKSEKGSEVPQEQQEIGPQKNKVDTKNGCIDINLGHFCSTYTSHIRKH